MMNAQTILQKIEDDARAAAAQAKADADRRAKEMTAASEERIQDMHDDIVARANAECEALAGRMRRMAELENRKQLLSAKRAVMDEAFAAAKSELQQTPANEARAFMLREAATAARGDETLLVGSQNNGWFDASFMDELNAALQKLGKPGNVKLGEGGREGVTGAVLLSGGTEVYCTFESMLESRRNELETDIARILFND